MMKPVLLSFFIGASALRFKPSQLQEGAAETTCNPVLKDLLQTHAVNNTVVFTTLDIADNYQPMIKNYACNVKRVGLPLLIWSINEKTHSKMVEFGFPDIYHAESGSFLRVTPFGKDYINTVRMKPASMQAVLNCGFDSLYLDSDLGIAENPLPYFQAHKGDVQISTNYPQHHMNTGVMHIRSSPQTRALMTEWMTEIKKPCHGFSCGDQEKLGTMVKAQCGGFAVKEGDFFKEDSKSANVHCSFSEGNHTLQIDLLPPSHFPDGMVKKKDVAHKFFTYHPNFSGMKDAVKRKQDMLKGMNLWCAE